LLEGVREKDAGQYLASFEPRLHSASQSHESGLEYLLRGFLRVDGGFTAGKNCGGLRFTVDFIEEIDLRSRLFSRCFSN
jgi:hypothetical protein